MELLRNAFVYQMQMQEELSVVSGRRWNIQDHVGNHKCNIVPSLENTKDHRWKQQQV